MTSPERKPISNEIQKLSSSAIIMLYEVDLSPMGGTIYRFHNGTNGVNGNIIWQGNEYSAYPIDITGYATNSKGQIARPNMRISNILNVISSTISSLDDILGAKVTRIATYAKFLDGANFASGTNPDAKYATFTDQVYYIERKVVENDEYIEFELTSPWDVHNQQLPARQIIQNVCTWVYKGPECGFPEDEVAADSKDNVFGSENYDGTDACSKSLTGCLIRFRDADYLPFGGFPGANKF